MSWTDERVELAEEALAGRPERQPDRRRARRRYPQRGDRQGAPSRPVRPRPADLDRSSASAAPQRRRPPCARLRSTTSIGGNLALQAAVRGCASSRTTGSGATSSCRSPSGSRSRSSPNRPANGRSAIPATTTSTSAATIRSMACPIASITPASPTRLRSRAGASSGPLSADQIFRDKVTPNS